MLNHVETIYDNMTGMMKKLKKASYCKNMEAFQEKNGHFFQEMIQYTEKSEDKETVAREIAERFTDAVWDSFSKNGKIRSITQADLNLFTIYYVFPAILLTGSDDATMIADHIRDAWAVNSRTATYNIWIMIKYMNRFRKKYSGPFKRATKKRPNIRPLPLSIYPDDISRLRVV